MAEATTLAVHRCRFVDFTPSAVTALCFPPLRLPSVKGKKSTVNRKPLRFPTLAVGRANGNIELHEWTGAEGVLQAPQAWVVRKTLAGIHGTKVDSLAFAIKSPDRLAEDEVPTTANLRLFSAGGSSSLAEWDTEQACVRRMIDSQGGLIWCIAPNPASTLLAIGCEDGAVRLLSLEHDTLSHLRRFDRLKCRILSIAWGPPVPRETTKETADGSDSDDENEDDWSDAWLVTGCSDSSLRKWDVPSGRVTDRMTTERVRGERTLVWTVGALGDGTIVSGDSMGIVKFWDPITCTQVDSFQGHAADVLCLTISPEGTVVYTSGVDQKVTQYSHIKTPKSQKSSSLLSRPSARWIQTSSRRLHSHDVRGLAIWPPHTPVPVPYRRQYPIDVAPILASGGLDMSVVVTPAALATATATKIVNPLATSTTATFDESYHRRLAYSSGLYNASAVHLARKARLLLCTRDAGVSVWRILQKRDPSGFDDVPGQNPDSSYQRVLDMDLNVSTNLVASAISDDGRWIAVADWYETKLFHLHPEKNGNLKPKRIRDFSAVIFESLPEGARNSTGASSLMFTPDSTRLVVATAMSCCVLVIDLNDAANSQKPRILRRFEQHRMKDAVIGDRVVKGAGKKRRHRSQKHKEGAEDIEMADAQQSGGEEKDHLSDSETELAPAEGRNTLLGTITRMAISPDGQWLVTTDERCRTHVFNLDAIVHHALLPTFPAPVHALAFDPSQPSVLVLGLANNGIHVYDVETRSFPTWARALERTLPQRFAQLHDPILGVTFDPGSAVQREGADENGDADERPLPPRNALFWGATWLCRIKLDADQGWGGFEKKRRRDTYGRVPPPPDQNFRLVTHYRSLLFVDFIASTELVVVERPLVEVLASLPPAFFKPKYGKT
ncbi:WD40 repeat-like protein [Laetiporus sulphureus 93-53]|uniref:WD40 repeat-like protein n=1 Tax=Laetiporus sulphureus 93-53 TaxID=1314785 RepID=A0A165ECZ2_9APHY|nr:WD40 repeat-like protein [Laetiporus sulphureus 93-53]KZT06760.1 WD40 repeat-like protein [Laetiporus sulphureus 93-53]